MKKAILLFISVFLICSMLALTACSSDQVTNENEGSVTENTENAEENTEENAEEESEIAFTDSVGLNYYLNDDAAGYTVYGIGSFKGDCLVIPEVYNGLPVVNIDEYAFSGCDQIKTLVISKNIKKIAYKAFYSCTMLEEIYFRAENMEDLEENNKVFYNAGKSTEGISVFFGKDVVKIPAYLFNPFSNLYTPNIKKMSFWKASECTSIGKYAFSGCDALTNVDIPE